ncbi:MAG: DUF1249 domain-containing protein [Gammaproteobacteria bacterium]|nr:DUF1249 domain-containing protein [Gammaproteobacteria bacterium]
MLADSDIVPECVVGPGTLGGLIALYEGNFIKLKSLLGDPSAIPSCCFSSSPTDCRLHLSVQEDSRYTRLLRLTYLFDEPLGIVADPDLVMRVYLDARVVEVISWADFHRHDALRELQASLCGEIDRRWSRNMVLSKWLDYLLHHEHVFSHGLATV